MKPFIVSLLLCLSFVSQAQELPAFESKDTPIADFVSWFSGQSGQTIVLGQGVNGNVSFSSNGLRTEEYAAFFESVLASHGYTLIERNGFYTVVIDEEEQQAATEPSKVKLYRLTHVRNSKIVELMSAMLKATSEKSNAKVSVENYDVQYLPTTNGIIVTGSEEQLAQIDVLISGIDQPQKQVFIEAIITETELNENQETGVNLTSALGNAGFVSNTLSIDKAVDNVMFFDDGNFSAFVKALEKSEDTNLLSKPRMMIMDRERGYISVGQNVPFLVSTEITDGGKQIQQVERKDVGVSLEVIPHIMNKSVILQINQESSSVSKSSIAKDIITNKRTLQTVVKVEDGQTLVLGGLISNENRLSESGVPILKDIPLLGKLFSSEKTEEVQKVLKIVIKTSII